VRTAEAKSSNSKIGLDARLQARLRVDLRTEKVSKSLSPTKIAYRTIGQTPPQQTARRRSPGAGYHCHP
jgi:hypothetical protein